MIRASLFGPKGLIRSIDQEGEDLDAIMVEADKEFPKDHLVVVQGSGGSGLYKGMLRGPILARRYPSKGGVVWRKQ